MLQEWLARLPQDAGPRGLAFALVAAGAGLLLWVVGARFSRSIFTLVGVAVGAWVGLRLPRWMGWEIDAMAIAIGGALVIGMAGYLLHTAWVGLTLGTLLASAAGFIVWHRLGATWTTPVVDPTKPIAQALRELLPTLPGLLPAAVRWTLAGGFVAGGLIAWVWPKMGRVLAFSLLGTLLLAGGAVDATALGRPQWLAHLPPATQTQGMVLALLVALSAVIQWALCPRPQASLPTDPRDTTHPAFRAGVRGPRDVRDLGVSTPGPLKVKLKEVRA